MAFTGGLEFTLTDNSGLIKESTREEILTALRACGVQAQAHATAEITANGAIDTGRLKNSITFAVSGDSSRQHAYNDDEGTSYSEIVNGGGKESDQILYLGTNVEYAQFVEAGTHKMAARPFIRPAVQNNIAEFQDIFLTVLSKIGK